MVDVTVHTVINKPPEVVAAYAGNPENAPEWYSNIKSVDWKTSPPLRVGSQLAFSARLLRRTLNYVYEFTELEPGRKLVMRTSQGPFPMQTTYTWNDADGGATRMSLRNNGTPAGFSRLANLVMAPMIRRATRKDLARLKELLESR
ncbi:SRPBCC family protein [Arthrobacter sp. ISL-30]|uniref:SRPBCC family protein n=1 Tax=Arthrobacter sp. ISL-30 TaxID=2819109 RepID=UPI001BEC2DE2|nr:SRPBCC family protein [Arthrobacter sp. ISL-30]MBT2515010.1 SRPBCC family protein [Arthrobacter sp. ISL-30]